MLHFADDSIITDLSVTRVTSFFMACQSQTAVYGIQGALDVHKMLDSVHTIAEEMQQCGEMNWRKVETKRMDCELRTLAATFNTVRKYGNCSSL
jgi:hypothetical protein